MENKNLHYILGLDLGIASVGWAVVEIDEKENPLRLIDVGVRTFERAEVPKTGESLALSRRLARSARRLTQRRVARLKKAKRLLKSENILLSTDERLPHQVWQLRVEGLDRKLKRQEWAAVLLHLIKHRGYLSQRKNESKSENKELGALLSGVASNHELLQQATYRTPAELAVKKFEVEEGHIRNQQGAYTHTFSRLDLLAEMELLFSRQQHFGNPFASEKLLENLTSLLMWQKPALSGEAILKMLGKCTFEDEYKAAKNTYSAERFVWITKLNNLRIQENGLERALNDNERLALIETTKRLLQEYDIIVSKEGPVDLKGFGDTVFGHFDDKTKEIQVAANKGFLRIANMANCFALTVPIGELSTAYVILCDSNNVFAIRKSFIIAESLYRENDELSERYFLNYENYFMNGYSN